MPSRVSVQRLLSALAQSTVAPLISETTANRLVAPWDQPSLTRPPWQARLQGFKAGAASALMQQNSSPLAVAAMGGAQALKAVQPMSRAARAALEAGQFSRHFVKPTTKVAEAAPEALVALDARITGLMPRAPERSIS